MSEWKKQTAKKQELDDDQLEQVSGGNDALPAEQLEDEIVIDNAIMLPQIVTDADPGALRSK